jgi:tetratricopeptide (TPR) repeat protein
MKKTLLLAGVLASFAVSAQNVDDQKISFNYIQQPITPIKGTKVFSIVVDHSVYQASNDDSLQAFELQLNLAESQLESWIEQKKKIDQMYLLEMAKWEKSVNAGAALTQPNKQPYPEMPKLKEELRMPILTEEISDGIVDGKVSLEGFSKGEGGAVVTIQFSGIRETNIVEKVTGSGATKKYEYTAEYLMPYSVKVESPGQGVILNENMNLTKKTKAFNKYDSKYDFEYWCIDNLDNFWKTLQQEEVNSALATVNNLINDKCGFPLKSNNTEVYTVKKHKGHNYSDLIDGYTKAKSGYDLVYKSISRKEAASNLQKAISIWEDALTESNTQDNKARINDKVTALLFVNLAEAYIWLGEYTKADNYIQKAKITNEGAGKYKREAKDLENLMNDIKARELANQ